MAASNVPNTQLRQVLAEAGWTGQQLASAVNVIAAETGVTVSYDRTAVSHWLAGTRPRGPGPHLIAEALSRALGQAVTPGQIGMAAQRGTAPGAGVVLPDGASAHPAMSHPAASASAVDGIVAVLAVLGDAATDRRKLTAAGPYSPGATTVGVTGDAILAGNETSKLAHGQVVATTAMTGLFSSADLAFGGGHARVALARYLAYQVGPLLRLPARPRLRRQLLAAATELSYLCGFMFFDDELHGAAQRYYGAALGLAAANGDLPSQAITLRALSVEAGDLGHHRHAVHLAEAAVVTGRGTGPLQRAFLDGQLAVAYAVAGDRRQALSSLIAAERRLDRATSRVSEAGYRGAEGPRAAIGAYHRASFAHQNAAVLAALGNREEAITALTDSIRHRPYGERRSRAITLARLAELQLTTGHLEAAVASWNDFLDEYPALTSRRVASAFRTMRAAVRPHGRNPSAAALLRRATSSHRSDPSRADVRRR
jgi:tetratricopeptide (TPR) repeat protein